jgi:DNA-binding transcriptional regulator YiaG
MPNIATALKQEITRLARKEQRDNTLALKKALASYRSEIAALKRRVADLERGQKRVTKVVAKVTPSADDEESQDSNLRFRAAGFAQHRKRLGLSAAEMGLLLDASGQSIYKWETGTAKPRAKHLQAIAAVRKMGKREAAKRLEELSAAS